MDEARRVALDQLLIACQSILEGNTLQLMFDGDGGEPVVVDKKNVGEMIAAIERKLKDTG